MGASIRGLKYPLWEVYFKNNPKIKIYDSTIDVCCNHFVNVLNVWKINDKKWRFDKWKYIEWKSKKEDKKMRYIPTVVVAFSCDFVVANPILIKKLSNGQKKATFYFFARHKTLLWISFVTGIHSNSYFCIKKWTFRITNVTWL